MNNPVQTLPTGNTASITELLAQLDKMIGGGKTTSNSTTTPDASAVDQENLLLQKIFADINPASLDAMVGNILERAKQTFGPAAISANAGGIRAYSDTVLESMRNEAMARATGEAVSARLDAVSKANATAASLVNNRLASSKSTQQTSKTGPSTVGAAAGLLTLGSAGMNIYKKLKDLYQPNAIGDDNLASGGEGFISDADSYASSDGGGLTPIESGAGGTGSVADSGGGTSVVAPPTEVMTDSSPFLSSESMAEQNTLAAQGLEGSGELSEVPMLSLPSEADMALLNQQAAEAFQGAGELSNIPALGGGTLEEVAATLPSGEEMATLSTQAEEGISGAGELSEVPALSDQPAPGAGAPAENLNSTTTGVSSGGEVIGPDVGTPIQQILEDQGLQIGSAMPAAITIDPATTETASQVALAEDAVGTGGTGAAGAITSADVIGADVGTPIEQILESQGLTQGSAMPAAVAESTAPAPVTNISALDTSIPDFSELSSLVTDSEQALQGAGELSNVPALTGTVEGAAAEGAAAGGATAAAETTEGVAAAAGGEEEAIATSLGLDPTLGIAGAIAADVQDIAAYPETNAITEVLAGLTGFGAVTNAITDALGGSYSGGSAWDAIMQGVTPTPAPAPAATEEEEETVAPAPVYTKSSSWGHINEA